MERRTYGLAGAGALLVGALAARELRAVGQLRRGEAGVRSHEATLGAGLGEPLQLVLLGDSAVDGYGLPVEESLPRQLAARLARATDRRVRVRSLAISGATAADVVLSQLPLLRAAGRLDAVVVGVGVNEALRLVDLDEVERSTRELVAGIDAVQPGVLQVWVPCHDLGAAPGLGPVLRRAAGWSCRRVRRRQRRVLDELGVRVAAADRRGGPQIYGDDGLHPGPAAIDAIASLCVGQLVAAR